MINIREFLGLSYFTSELDQFLQDFDQSHPNLSASQRKEMEKYARLNAWRDTVAKVPVKKTEMWDQF